MTKEMMSGKSLPEEDFKNMIEGDLKRKPADPEVGSYGEAIEKIKKLEKKEGFDSLTGVLDRGGFEKAISKIYEEVASLNKRKGDIENAAVIYIDIDDFKPINDLNDHEYGDKVLIEFARKLEQIFREGDVIARPGGDEFVVIMVGISEEDAEKAFKEKINVILKEFTIEIKIDNELTEKVPLSASSGMSMMKKSDGKIPRLEDIIKEADRNMYAAKQKHKDEHGSGLR